MLKKETNSNSIRDDEISDYVEKKSLFKKKDKKKSKEEPIQVNTDMFEYSQKEDTLVEEPKAEEKTEESGIDYNQKYLERNKDSGKTIIKTILVFAMFIGVIIYILPRAFHYDLSNKQKYVDTVNKMVEEVIAYYNQDGLECKTNDLNKYYFNVHNSKEIFGDDIVSPFIKNSLEGYIEFSMIDDQNYEIFVSFSDGVFGFERVKYNILKKEDIKVFPYLKLDHHVEMTCNKEFEYKN